MKIIDSKWIKVEPSELVNDVIEEKRNGVQIHIGVSPYNIPSAIRGSYDEAIQKFVIAFQYLDTETKEKTKASLSNNLTLEIGIHSGRIYRVLIDVIKLGVEDLRLSVSVDQIDDAFREFSEHGARRDTRSRSMAPLRAAFKQKRGKLFPENVTTQD